MTVSTVGSHPFSIHAPAIYDMLREKLDEARAQLKDNEGRVVCSYCGFITVLPKDINDDERRKFLLDHILVCDKRPELLLANDALAKLKAKDEDIARVKRETWDEAIEIFKQLEIDDKFSGHWQNGFYQAQSEGVTALIAARDAEGET